MSFLTVHELKVGNLYEFYDLFDDEAIPSAQFMPYRLETIWITPEPCFLESQEIIKDYQISLSYFVLLEKMTISNYIETFFYSKESKEIPYHGIAEVLWIKILTNNGEIGWIHFLQECDWYKKLTGYKRSNFWFKDLRR